MSWPKVVAKVKVIAGRLSIKLTTIGLIINTRGVHLTEVTVVV